MASLHVACPHCLGVDFRVLAGKPKDYPAAFEITAYACQQCRRVSRAEQLIAGEKIEIVSRKETA